MQMPWRTEIIQGLLGADLVTLFQAVPRISPVCPASGRCRRNRRCAVRFPCGGLGPAIRVGTFPYLDLTPGALDHAARDLYRRARIRTEPESAQDLLGVDRLDYTRASTYG